MRTLSSISAVVASLLLSTAGALAGKKVTEQQPVTIAPRDYAIVVLGARIVDPRLTARERLRLADDQDRWLEDLRGPFVSIPPYDPSNSGRYVTVTNDVRAIGFGLAINKKELPRRGVVASKDTRDMTLGDGEYVKADANGRAYAVWRLPTRKGAVEGLAYIATMSTEFNVLPVWSGPRQRETYIVRFTIQRPGWYYLGDVLVSGFAVESMRFEKRPYGVNSAPGYETTRYEYEKMGDWKVVARPVCEDARFAEFAKTARMSPELLKSKKRSAQEWEDYVRVCASWEKVTTR